MNYIEFDKKDSGDGFTNKDGFLCVIHNPGCGITGNNGEDKFFSLNKQLPATAKLEKVEFTPFWPAGLGPGSGGTIGGWGSFGMQQKGGPTDPSQTVLVDWNNACQGTFAGRNLDYSVSFIVSVPHGMDLGEQTFDPAQQTESSCKFDGTTTDTETPKTPGVNSSGLSGTVRICNAGIDGTNGTLHLEGALTTAVSGAQGTDKMKEDIPLQFQPSGSAGSVTPFSTQQIYKQGTWQITSAKVVGLTGAYPNLPFTTQLPGGPGSTNLDFTGGRCPL